MYEHLIKKSSAETFAFSAENPTGERAGGGRGGDCTKLRPCVNIKAGETVILVDVTGSGIIQSMWFGGYAGHNFILRMYWEDETNPSVEVPLSAFFGCVFDESFCDRNGNYPVLNSSVMLVAPSRGLNCYFPMPYKKKCKITMENRGASDENLYYTITGCKTEIKEDICYFHASYRQARPVENGKTYTIIDDISGNGHFVGITLGASVNNDGCCWVEGEARIYIDGDKYPSIHYTGTEDYFGGSFAFGNDIAMKKYQTYSGHYTGMFSIIDDKCKDEMTKTRFLLYRFHISDPIYFKENFKFTLDNLGNAGARSDEYFSVAYWYQTLPFKKLKELPCTDLMNM